MSEILIFHPAGIGDFLMDLSNLYQLINSKTSTKKITYVCNEINKPLVEYSGINNEINIQFLKWPTASLSDLLPLIRIGQRAKKIFVLSGMNLRKVGYLTYFWSNKVELFGTLENYPDECYNKMRPSRNIYQYIEGPSINTHRIIENFKLFKSQKMLINSDFIIKGLRSNNLEKESISISNNLPYIVVHTSLGDNDFGKSMDITYWAGLLSEIRKKIKYKIIIIGSIKEKKNIELILSIIVDDNIISVCGEKSLNQIINIISDSKMMLAVDGGMAHLAASLNKDLVTIFGPTNSHNISPVDTYGLLISNQIECSPCYWSNNYYNCPYDRKCLNEINQDIIIDSVLDVISGKRLENYKINNCYITKIPSIQKLISQI
jgi:ADP-heptose:LPS heptosyltransferase